MRKKAPAKLNVFLKVVGKRGSYHELFSRFVRLDELYDELSICDRIGEKELDIQGDFSCAYEENTITKAYNLLKENGYEKALKSFFKDKGIKVKKNIPEFAGLGGGSSDGASFLLLCNEALELGLSKEKLMSFGLRVGADVPFFVSECKSANVRGIGEKIEEFEEDLPRFELKTPDVLCSTAKVFGHFKFNKEPSYSNWVKCSSKAILENFSPLVLNDLYKSVLELYPDMRGFYDKGYFLSGSGSSVFKVKHG